MNIITPAEFDAAILCKYPRVPKPEGNQQTRSRPELIDCVAAFDIETSVVPGINQAVMYVWQFSLNNDVVIIGRTWPEFLDLLETISAELDDMTLVVYVHNLSYEFQFLRGVYEFGPEDVFALAPRKILKAKMYGNIEFRCSYMLSNCKLAAFCKDMRTEHQKIDSGKYDHTIIRYPWTPWESFSELEREYMINDVVGLVEAVRAKMNLLGDTLHTIPLTSTGYVRRDAKNVMAPVRGTAVFPILPDVETYVALREAFRGGDTHANRFYSGDTLRADTVGVRSFDRSSSYPDVIVHCQFPVGEFKPYTPGIELADVLKRARRHNRAFLIRLALWDVDLRDPTWPMPYIPSAKCRRLCGGKYDNGRVLSADYLEITVTDVDMEIILATYKWGASRVLWGRYARYGKLPAELTDLVISYYKNKTELKNVPGQELYYNLSKALLNAIYGMMAQDPVKADTIYEHETGYTVDAGNIANKLEKYNKKAFLPYQWGVWTTAWARYRLFESYLITGNGTVYADTDSNKFLDDPDHPADFTEFNNARIADCMESGAFAADPNGEVHYMGVFEEETPEAGLYEFRTLGAKKYAYREKEGGPVTITIAGVPKADGAGELDAAGGIDAFEDGMVFRAGKIQIVYNDTAYGWHEVDGHRVYITANAAILPNEYTVGITSEYGQLITESKEYARLIANRQLEKYMEERENGFVP